MKLIKNARLYTMTSEEISGGMVVFDNKIIYAGAALDAYANMEFDEIIDAQNQIVMPGMVDAHTHLGMFEDALGFEGDDGNEDSDPITPQLRAIDGINPFDRGFEDARRAGVTAVVTGPGSANPVGGQFAAVKTAGICIDDMIIKSPCAMKMALGENPKVVYKERDEAPFTRMGTMSLIRELLFKAQNYKRETDAYNANSEENEKPEFDIKLDAMLPVLNREIPVKIHAHRADDICSAIRLGKEFDIDVTLEHCSDGDRIAPILEREALPINLGPTLGDRSKPELKNLSFDTYRNLSDRGLKIAIITDHPEITEDNLPLCAALAVKHGMNEYKALEAITITAAQNCRIDDRVGSLEKGKDADIVIMTDLPTRFDSKCVKVFIDGKEIQSLYKLH
ncbi:MAG: amidohydrolase [bacterium]|nr:amidohydrolase [bacterium]